MKTLTKRLRILRAAANITQRDVAAKVEIPLQRYWEIENGYRVPTSTEKARIAKALKTSVAEAFDDTAAVGAA
jgi:transcriptional regulator with XRE-family HTH domain